MFNRLNKKEVILPLIAFISIFALIVATWNVAIKSHNQTIEKSLIQTGEFTSQEFNLILKRNRESIENLKIRLEYSNGKTFQYWQEDAQLLLEQNHSFLFVEWIDSTMVIKNIVPLMGNERVLNLDISKLDYRKKEWIAHSLSNTTNITPWVTLKQGGQAFLIDVPVYFDNKFQGTVSAGMDFKENLNKIAENLDLYPLEMKDSDGTVFYTYGMQDTDKETKDFVYEKKILVDKQHGIYWTLKLYPSKSPVLTDRLYLINFSLLIGFFLALLIGLLIHFYIKAKDRTKRAIEYSKALSKSNRNLNSERNRAEKASKAKSKFLSNMSHEIRTPLHAIIGFVQIIKNSKLNETDKVYVDLLDKSSTNLLSIVNDILVIDKIEMGKIPLEKINFNPSKKIQELITSYSHLFFEKNLYVHTNFKEPFGANALGDQNKLLQIITNLLKNAAKFTVKGGVMISYAEEQIDKQLKVTITIEDSGIGIPKNKIDTIFKRFTQIDSSFKKQYEGSGLGLSISKNLVSIMNGSIKVNSVLNQGSVFEVSVEFEITKNQAKDKDSANGIYENIDLSYLNVLIVDDNKLNVVILKKILEDRSIKVDTAINGKIAVEKVKSNNYDIIFMDIHMPKMDGYQATRCIRKFNTDIKIFGLSANVTPEASAKALDSGMNNYLTKPFTKEQLYKLLSTTLIITN